MDLLIRAGQAVLMMLGFVVGTFLLYLIVYVVSSAWHRARADVMKQLMMKLKGGKREPQE